MIYPPGPKDGRKAKGQAAGLMTGGAGIGRLLLALVIIATVVGLLEQARKDRNQITSRIDQSGGMR